MALIYAMTSLLSNNKNVGDLLPLIELVSSVPAAVRHTQSEAEASRLIRFQRLVDYELRYH